MSRLIDTWWRLALLAVCVSAVAMVVTALVARGVGRVSVIDVAWGLTLTAIALAMRRCSARPRRGAVGSWSALVAVWGCRLAWHICRRSRGHGEDPRYEELLGGASGCRRRASARSS